MIKCTVPGCNGELREVGFTKKATNQNCPQCGRYMEIDNGPPMQFRCASCDVTKDLEETLKIYVCSTCKTVVPEDRLKQKNNA